MLLALILGLFMAIDVNGDFEDATGWSLLGGGCEITTGNARSGVHALRMHTEGDPDLDPSGAALASYTFTSSPGATYLVSGFVSGADYVAGGAGVQVFRTGGQSIGTVEPIPGGAYGSVVWGLIDSAGTSTTINLFSTSTFTASAVWIDDLRITEANIVAKLNAIKSALQTDIESVTNVVYSGVPLAEGERVDYSVALVPGEGGTTDDQDYGGVRVTQRYELNMLRKGDSAETDVYTLLDALRDAIDVNSSNVGALWYVNNATVRSWEKAQITKSAAGNHARITATVEVVFYHTRGDA